MKTYLKILFLILSASVVNCKKDDTVKISTHEVTEITATSAVCGGEMDDYTLVRIAGLIYDTDPRYLIYTTLVDTVTREKKFSLKMTGLTPNTKYYVRAWAGESGRPTGYGAVKEFTTLPE